VSGERARLSLILAADLGWGIGQGGQLPWRLPADLARFRALTMGKALIVGRRTYESIGRPLPGRRMIVLSRSADFLAPGCEVVPSLAAALDRAEGHADEVFVGGGAAVFAEALPRADRVYLTLVLGVFACDTRLAPIWPDPGRTWNIHTEELRAATDRDPHASVFLVADRAAGQACPV
jgi:dihydrofolate reductase